MIAKLLAPARPFLALFAALVAIVALAPAALATDGRERTSFNADWRFTKGDPAGTGDALTYAKIREWLLPTGREFLAATAPQPARPAGNLGADVAYTSSSFDDTSWRKLDLPHDWGIEGPFKQEYQGETGKLPWWGIAWYRKHFTVPAEDAGKRVYLDVDGAMSHATVWLNGQFVGGWPYGYASWRVDLTPYLKPGSENIVAIRLDNPADSSRWYPGGGIYRNVWLVKTAPVHVAHWGTFITTPVVTADSATIDLKTTLQNDANSTADIQVTTEVFSLDATGRRVGASVAMDGPTTASQIAAGQQEIVAQSFALHQPKLWSPRSPNRYVAVTTLTQTGKTVDTYETPFGVRTIAFDANNGFLINGERLPIQGVCNHHDLGALGAALNVRALERQLEMLRDMGCNAIRTSHNPPAPELLELCDRMGFVVMDEAFDAWHSSKKPNDYHLLYEEWHDKDLRAYIRRDRNHPSVVLWSIGNEVKEQGAPDGPKFTAALAAIVHSEDRTRPVTAACNNAGAGFNGFQNGLDVMGFNYAGRGAAQRYGRFHTTSPEKPVMGSETSSCVSSRGEYFFPVSDNKLQGRANFQVSSYDLAAPNWGSPPDAEFRALAEYPFAAGEFVWTGFDYLGEPTPYNKDETNLLNFTDAKQRARAEKELAELKKIPSPSRSSYFGIIDLAGFKKDRFYIYQAHWRPDFPMAHLLPHWTWPDRVGEITPVHVYTSGDEAELFLNGQSLGRKKRGALEYRLRWDDVKYQPGELRVVAYRDGKKWAEDVVHTAGAATKLTLTADRKTLHADGSDLSFITVAISDANGTMVPQAKNKIRFEVSGPADVVATDNGDATSFEPFQSNEHSAYNGLALAIVRTRADQPGAITVRAISEGLAGAEITLRSDVR
jgi:beta-galactosidase